MAKQKQRQRREEQRPLHHKYCQFCRENTEFIDYKDTQLLRKYTTDRAQN
jgi:small subunit ribosomal protein S18